MAGLFNTTGSTFWSMSTVFIYLHQIVFEHLASKLMGRIFVIRPFKAIKSTGHMQSSHVNSPIMISSPHMIFKFTSSYFINLSQSCRVTFQTASIRLHLIPGAESACAKNCGDDFRLWDAVFRGRKHLYDTALYRVRA